MKNKNITIEDNDQFVNKNELQERKATKTVNNNKDIKEPLNEKYSLINGIDDDIYMFMEEIHKQNNKVRKFGNKIGKENKTIVSDTIVENKSKTTHFGLSDNNTVDAENKSKAQKGLLLLLNKLSGGDFVPEIKTYFTKKKEEIKMKKKKDLEEKANEEEKNKILEKRKMSRQKNMSIFKNETFNNIFKEENEEMGIDSLEKKYNEHNIEKKNTNVIKQQAMNLNRFKNFDEDREISIYDNLIMYFTKKEAQEITEMRKNEEENNNFKFIKKEGFKKENKKKDKK